MKNCDWKNAFGPAPENFRHQLMQTLNGLEEREMKYVKKYSLKVIAVAAAIITLLVATAVAVVQGNILRTGLTNGGGEKLAAHVQDVHVTDARSDFSFTIDEVLWEEDMLFASYTVTVPEDGKLYLFSPCDLQINGQNIGYDGGIDAQFFTRMFALGGEYGVSVSQIMQMKVLEGMDNGADNQFSCSCVFMQAQKPIVKLEEDAYGALFTEPDAHGNENQLMKNADILYYTDTTATGDAVPVLYLHQYPEVCAVRDKNDVVSADALEQIGIARNADVRTITISIQKSDTSAVCFNNVVQRNFDMNGYSIEITKLEISRFKSRYEAIIRKDGSEATEWTAEEPYGQYYALCNADGTTFGTQTASLLGAYYTKEKNGKNAYCVDGSGEGIYPVDGLEEIYLAPSISDENGATVGYDMTHAIKITPIFTEKQPEVKPDPADTDDLSS